MKLDVLFRLDFIGLLLLPIIFVGVFYILLTLCKLFEAKEIEWGSTSRPVRRNSLIVYKLY